MKRPYATRKVEDGVYDVVHGETVLGTVRRDDDAWSYAPWCIDGDVRKSAGGRGESVRRAGYRRLRDAAREIAVMNSALLMRDRA